MLKKWVSLMLSLLISLSVVANQAQAVELPKYNAPQAQEEVVDSETLDESGNSGIIPLEGNDPDREDTRPNSGIG